MSCKNTKIIFKAFLQRKTGSILLSTGGVKQKSITFISTLLSATNRYRNCTLYPMDLTNILKNR